MGGFIFLILAVGLTITIIAKINEKEKEIEKELQKKEAERKKKIYEEQEKERRLKYQKTREEAIKKDREQRNKKYKISSEKNYWEEGTKYKCLDGHKVRSKAEREIDNFFYINRIWHVYEYQYEHPETKELTVPDFFLPDYNLIIEYFGLDTQEYLLKKEHKIQLYQSDNNINFEYLSFENDENIYDKLSVLMKKHNIPLK